MVDAPASEISSGRFRYVLGHYPTGVAVVTAVVDGKPIGMVVGSFSSVSLDPPLVCYMPDRASTTYRTLERAESFVVNVVSADDEELCRTIASKTIEDKWSQISWRPSSTGAPVLDAAIAWVECTKENTYAAGDHYIVIGRVSDLDVAGTSAPLLFFQGGYGRFATRSLLAPSDSGLMAQIQMADVARSDMEALAADFGCECTAQALVESELVIVASAGAARGGASPSRVAMRMPLTPPHGTLHMAWSNDDATEAWLKSAGAISDEQRQKYLDALQRVRQRGWSVGLVSPRHAGVEEAVTEFSTRDYTKTMEARLRQMLGDLNDVCEPADSLLRANQSIRFIAAPVFAVDGSVPLSLRMFSLPTDASSQQIEAWRDRLLRTARSVTNACGGRFPAEIGTLP